jgi:hypothetical protein
MVNIINKLEQRNKNLLEENENFKLKIYNAIHNVMESESPEIAGTLMTLQQHFWSWDEWVKVQEESGVEKISFGNEFTFENIIKGFTEWTLLNCDSYSHVSKQNKKLEERNAELEPKVVELETKQKELETKQKELEFRVEELEDEVEMEREEAEKALEVSRLERWEPKVSLFTETIKAKEDDLDKASARIKLLENFMAWQNYVACKQFQELPVLPKKTNKFKLLGSKIKSKVNQTKEIVKEKFNAFILQKSK